ncbi:MAG: PIN domain-containing protein [Bradyrhizobium sp.]|nr:PIN domain-containing protein [Bradyrhizobium sp.]
MAELPYSPLYLDTNFFIKAVEGLDETAAPAKALIGALRKRPGLAATSEITFAEVLAPSRQADALSPQMKRRVYLDLLLWSGFVALIPVSRNVLIETAKLRTMSRFRLPDAIHLVSAVQVRCRFFISADKDFDRMPEGIERVDCNHDSLPRLLEWLS